MLKFMGLTDPLGGWVERSGVDGYKFHPRNKNERMTMHNNQNDKRNDFESWLLLRVLHTTLKAGKNTTNQRLK